ncbi:MAG: DUF1573 domain-containing protein [Prevotellaceae bacterium]|jgi:hypothetical protein|nr:DUF1573 domain-containing protein [Prevotellaceae bacterium]
MKRLLLSILLSALVVLAATAQPRFSSDKQTYSFGQIAWKRPVTVEYHITNTGTRPLLLSQVEPDCACTATEWTRSAIAPGHKGVVAVTFDAQSLGHFAKAVAVHTNAQAAPFYLHFSGWVKLEVKEDGRDYPYLYDQIRLDKEEIAFADTHRGEQPTMQIGVINLSDQPYEPVLMHLPSYLKMTATPAVLQPQERGIITLRLQTGKLELGLTRTSVYLSRFMGDKVSAENELPFTVVLLPDFSSTAASAHQPAIHLSATQVDLSTLPVKKNKAQCDIRLANTGEATLHIDKLQVFNPAVGVSLKKRTLKAGETTRLRITVDRKASAKKKQRLRVLLITNDPRQPKVEINLHNP